MDLDRKEPSEKSFSLSYARDYKPDTVRRELARCTLLCALGHRRKTFKGVYLNLLASPEGTFRPNVKVTPAVVAQVLELKRQRIPQHRIAKEVGLSQGVVSNIVPGKYRNSKLG